MLPIKARPQVSIVIPTYNERENVRPLYDAIRSSLAGQWRCEIIFVDDSSPDGTAEEIRRLPTQHLPVKLLQRPAKLGLGSAVVEGFQAAQGDFWVMMDGDLSHRPEDLPRMLSALDDAGIVVDSRFVEGGRMVHCPLNRKLAGRAASGIGRMTIGMGVKDTTSGFVAFRKESLQGVLPALKPRGFKLLLEILVLSKSAIVKEVPITFVDRRYGSSKLSVAEVMTFVALCWRLRRNSGKDCHTPVDRHSSTGFKL